MFIARPDVRNAIRLAGEKLRRFALWWEDEMLALLPRRVRAQWRRQANRVIVEAGDGTVRVWLNEHDASTGSPTLELAESDEDASGSAPSVLRRLPASAIVILRFPESWILDKTFTLPAATQENLREVLGYEMDRHTPFKADDVYYNFLVTARNLEHNRISVNVVVVPRFLLDPHVARLRELGLEATKAEVKWSQEHRGRDWNFLPPEQRAAVPSGNRTVRRSLAIGALALAVGVVVTPLVDRHMQLARLKEQVAHARDSALRVKDIQAQIAEMENRYRMLSEKRDATPRMIALLNELSRIIPDDTWVVQLEINGKLVKIRGESSSASNLIPLIEASSAFKDASFASPVTRNPRTEQERFMIVTHVTAREDAQ